MATISHFLEYIKQTKNKSDMKKQFILIVFTLVSFQILNAQIINQDNEGYSTIVIPNSDFSLDLKNNIAKFTIANYIKKDTLKPFLGLELKGSEKNNTSILFSNGSLARNASINILYRIGQNNIFYSFKEVHNLNNELDSLLRQKEKYEKEIINNQNKIMKYADSIQTEIDNSSHKALQKISRNTDTLIINNAFKEIKEEKVKSYLHQKGWLKPLKENSKLLDENRKYRNNAIKVKGTDFAIYFRGGFSLSSLKYDTENGDEDIEKRFIDKDFYGGNFDVGFNYSINNTDFFGLSYKGEYTNNIGSLESVEYKFSKIDTTITNGTLTTTQTINSLSGKYETFLRHSINFDYVRVISLGDYDKEKGDYYLTLNAYVRQYIYSGTENYKPNTVIGLGINAFSSSRQAIMGGLFIQKNDLFNNNKDIDAFEKISIGIIAKYAFSGFSAK